ncbi:MAG: hypothetical protein QGD90_00180 [Candidatus Hydrogenedentes bacterium]|nr:hypothetical protein [Candidatus Hydrogenedentota bacterium]
MAFGVIRELVTRLGFTIDDAEARRYEKRLTDLGRKIRGVGRSLSLFVTLPIVALGASFIKAAADAEETENKFKQIFKGIEDKAAATTQAIARDFDLANVSVQEMVSSTGSLLVGFGFTRDAALEMANTVARVGADISSLNNVQGGAARASRIITKALLGETEGLKALDTAILQEDVKKKIAILTAQGMTFETNRQAKAFATLRLVIDQNRDAIGDYARSQDSATNRSRKLRERFKDLSVTLGKVLLPIYTDFIEVLTSVVEWLNSFSPAGRKAIVIIAGIAAALGPLLIVLSTVILALTAIVGLIGAIPLLIAAAIGAVAVLGFLIGDELAAFIQGRKSVLGLIFNALTQMFIKVFDVLAELLALFIKVHIDPLIAKVQPFLDRLAVTGILLKRGGPLLAASGITTMLVQSLRSPAVDPIVAGLRSQQALQQIRASDPGGGLLSGGIFNANITINPPRGTSERVIAEMAVEEFQRFAQETRSLAAAAGTGR